MVREARRFSPDVEGKQFELVYEIAREVIRGYYWPEDDTETDISLNVTYGEAPLEISATLSAPKQEGYSYSWIFNGGPRVEGESAKHTYKEPGEYSIILLEEYVGKIRTTTRIVRVAGEGQAQVVQKVFRFKKYQFPQAFEVEGSAGKAYLDSAVMMPVHPPESDKITSFTVLDRDGNFITTDLFIPEIKESISFDIITNLRSQIFERMMTLGLPESDWAAVYKQIDQRYSFVRAVRAAEEEQRTVGSSTLADLKQQIALEVISEFYRGRPNWLQNSEIGGEG